MLTAIAVELLKLRRSLVLPLLFAAPGSVVGIVVLALATRREPLTWDNFLNEGLAMWAFFMLPMALTTLTMVLAQLEHVTRMWSNVLTAPRPKFEPFAAKIVVALLGLVVMQALLLGGVYAGGIFVDALSPGRLSGDRQIYDMVRGLGLMACGAVPLIAVQLWLALRLRSFVVPLAIGIAGTFLALVATSAGVDLYLPWLLPAYAAEWPKGHGPAGVWGGLLAGAMLSVALVADLARSEPV